MTRDVYAIKQILERRTAETLRQIAEMKASGDQAGLDALLQNVNCPQESDISESHWVSYWPRVNYDWRLRAWLRDNLIGRFCLGWARSGDPDYELLFERSEDAVACKMRWG